MSDQIISTKVPDFELGLSVRESVSNLSGETLVSKVLSSLESLFDNSHTSRVDSYDFEKSLFRLSSNAAGGIGYSIEECVDGDVSCGRVGTAKFRTGNHTAEFYRVPDIRVI